MFVFTNEGRAGRWGGFRTVASGARAAAPAEWAAKMSGHKEEKQLYSMYYVAGIFNFYGVYGARKYL